jgi:putative ABC transport system permease protein
LFEFDFVAFVIAVTALTEAVRDAFGPMVGMIQVMVVAVLVLALLIAFNSASINLEARVREHATMFSFGVRVRTALRMASVESLVVGVAAAALGTVGGLAMVWWITQRVLTKTLPDFGLEVVLTPGTVAMVGAVGILVVAAAPLLTTRKMVRMDLPRTLRLVE